VCTNTTRHHHQGKDPPILAAPDQKGGNQCWLTGGHVTKRLKQGNYSQVGTLDLLLRLKREDLAFWCYNWHHPRRTEGNGDKDSVKLHLEDQCESAFEIKASKLAIAMG